MHSTFSGSSLIQRWICILAFTIVLRTSSSDGKGESAGPALFNTEKWLPIHSNYDSASTERPPKPTATWTDPNVEIFVSLAEYRDSRCPLTLKNLFTHAKNPHRVFVGLVQQVHTEEDRTDCLKAFCVMMGRDGKGKCKYESQIRTIEFAHHDARGPTYAHYIGHELMKDEEFCMQLDSHSDVAVEWDDALTQMWGSISNEYAVLSTAVPDLSTLGQNVNDRWEVPHLCQAGFSESGLVRNLLPRAAMGLSVPLLAPLWSASFSFSKCHALKKTPYDPNLPHIFDGDEFARYARLWTRGYDVYTPSRTIVAHDYSKSMYHSAPQLTTTKGLPVDESEWAKHGMTAVFKRKMYEEALLRLYTLLGHAIQTDMWSPTIVGIIGSQKEVSKLTKPQQLLERLSMLGRFGLGHKRTLDQLIGFTGIDLRNQVILGDRCKELQWVPFLPDREPETEDGDSWGFAPEVKPAGGVDIPLRSGEKAIAIPGMHQVMSNNNDKNNHADSADSNSFNSNSNSNSRSKGSGSDNAKEESNSKLARIEAKLEADVERVVQEVDGELWWIFQHVDRAVEGSIDYIDGLMGEGKGHGHRVMKIVLLGAPVFLAVVFGALHVVSGGSFGYGEGYKGDTKRI